MRQPARNSRLFEPDPVLFATLRRDHPRLWPRHRDFVAMSRSFELDRLTEIDDQLAELSVARAAILARVRKTIPTLWPHVAARSVRRSPLLDEDPIAPAPANARGISGCELRVAAVELLRRYGTLSLRDLHSLLHRHGYEIDSRRPVQRLGDALAYETRCGRAVRVGRGVYAPVALGRRSPRRRPLSHAVELREDPQFWSGERWSEEAQYGDTGEIGADAVDADVTHEIRTVIELHEAARRRIASLIPPAPLHQRPGYRTVRRAGDPPDP